ncbi:hypothetical protein Pcinc_043903, partial [Petrolisthes cinctipes]
WRSCLLSEGVIAAGALSVEVNSRSNSIFSRIGQLNVTHFSETAG